MGPEGEEEGDLPCWESVEEKRDTMPEKRAGQRQNCPVKEPGEGRPEGCPTGSRTVMIEHKLASINLGLQAGGRG